MSLEQVLKEAQGFINESAQLASDYRAKATELNKKVQEGLRGSVEVTQELDKQKQQNGELLQRKAQALQEKISKIQELEIKSIEESEQSITADSLAELNLLSQLELSSQDMDKYINKYRRTPLALKKLKEIARENKLMNIFPDDREQFLRTILGRMESKMSDFSRPNYNSFDVTANMKAEGAIRSMAEDVSYYRSL